MTSSPLRGPGGPVGAPGVGVLAVAVSTLCIEVFVLGPIVLSVLRRNY